MEIEDKIISKIKERQQIGMRKYKISVKENPLTLIEWFTHLQEELLDGSIYIEKLKTLFKVKTEIHINKLSIMKLLPKKLNIEDYRNWLFGSILSIALEEDLYIEYSGKAHHNFKNIKELETIYEELISLRNIEANNNITSILD